MLIPMAVVVVLLAGTVGAADGEPEWLGSTIGIPPADHVPGPWTPVFLDGGATEPVLEVIGRTIALGADGLPSQIVSAGQPLLAAPPRLVARAGEAALDWSWQPLNTTPQVARATWNVGGRAGEWALGVSGSLDYDGLISLTFALLPPAGGGTIDELALELPLAPERALYHSWWPGQWGSAANSGALTGELALPFKPILWLGDNDRGLTLAVESDEGWRPADPERVLTVSPERVLRVALIERPTQLDRPWTTTILLHPTPIKPMPVDPHHLRINHGAGYGIESRPNHPGGGRVSYDAATVLDARQGTLEAWLTPHFDPHPELTEAQRAGRGAWNRELFNVRLPNGDQAGFYWNIDDQGMRFYVRRGKEHPIVLGHRSDWTEGEPQHIALTWGDAIRVYADGKLLAEQPFEGLLGGPTDLSGATFDIGGAPCEFALHALRTERSVRREFSPDAPPQPGPDTLLCQAGEALGESAAVSDVQRADGPFGRSLLLFDPALAGGTVLDALANAGVHTLVFHEHWTDVQDSGYTPHEAELRALSEAVHDRGMKLLLYFGYEMSDIDPEWERWHEQCLVAPRRGGYKRQPEQTAYIVCYNSVWQERTLEHIAHAVDAYGADGVYLDGTIEPWGCANERHGCGYVGEDGKRHDTYPILAVRSLMQRMYTLLAEREKYSRDGQPLIDAHQSLCMASPTLSWCSGYWDGEQLTSSYEPGRKPLEYLPLDTFRAEFMGRQWGIPAQFLNYAGRPFTPRQSLAFSLLHDVLPRGRGLDEVQQLVTPIWRALDAFGRAESRFVPYWDSAGVVAAEGEGVYVSAYDRPGTGRLLVVSNLGDAPVTATLRPIPAGLPAGWQATDALTGEPIARDGDALRLELPLLECRMLRLGE